MPPFLRKKMPKMTSFNFKIYDLKHCQFETQIPLYQAIKGLENNVKLIICNFNSIIKIRNIDGTGA